ncbi:MAG: hypothetical protein V1789_05160 [PVC group bacterium]
MDEQYDSEEIYCRRLGHYLTFRYCRSEKGELPCPKILDCWCDRLPIGEFLHDNYTEDEIAAITAPARPKMATLIELIERAKKRGG